MKEESTALKRNKEVPDQQEKKNSIGRLEEIYLDEKIDWSTADLAYHWLKGLSKTSDSSTICTGDDLVLKFHDSNEVYFSRISKCLQVVHGNKGFNLAFLYWYDR